jgi:hypothetical protein
MALIPEERLNLSAQRATGFAHLCDDENDLVLHKSNSGHYRPSWSVRTTIPGGILSIRWLKVSVPFSNIDLLRQQYTNHPEQHHVASVLKWRLRIGGSRIKVNRWDVRNIRDCNRHGTVGRTKPFSSPIANDFELELLINIQEQRYSRTEEYF